MAMGLFLALLLRGVEKVFSSALRQILQTQNKFFQIRWFSKGRNQPINNTSVILTVAVQKRERLESQTMSANNQK